MGDRRVRSGVLTPPCGQRVGQPRSGGAPAAENSGALSPSALRIAGCGAVGDRYVRSGVLNFSCRIGHLDDESLK